MRTENGAEVAIGAVEKLTEGSTFSLHLLFDNAKATKAGATIPVKIQLLNSGGANASASSLVMTATGLTKVSNNASYEVQDPGNANPDSNFRYDADSGGTGGYIFNLSTEGLTIGTYSLAVVAAGSPVGSITIQIR